MTVSAKMPVPPRSESQKLAEAHSLLRAEKELTPHQISLLARHACSTGDMAFYKDLFCRVEPQLQRHFQQNCEEAEFLADTGRVAGNVNIFRKLQYRSLSGPVLAFEKIYRRNSPDLKRLQWVYRNLWGRTPCRMPQIIEIVQGRRLSVVLFAFEAFAPATAEGLFEIMRRMTAFSMAYPVSAFAHVDAVMLDMPKLYRQRREDLSRNLITAGFGDADMAQTEAACMDTVHVFNHADLHRFNVGQNGMIYDWDSSCFAPAAHDPGRTMASIRTFRHLSGLHGFISKQLQRDLVQERSEVARIIFFYLVYAAKRKLTEEDDAALRSLRTMFREVQTALA